ncbi:hypothetical protein DSO57_1014740 [Entomophthora muscae]|uniref:Uncharacterized protein n=1 Tax=Entomophthora muscae TaxID=34485 RepID=A0ACC2SU77_9FUNG|nr:hypothetical protein DSO57_1014740 [Entomophthora muscae]
MCINLSLNPRTFVTELPFSSLVEFPFSQPKSDSILSHERNILSAHTYSLRLALEVT